MSPFTQLTDFAGRGGSSIDRNFSPLLSYIDEFDRHFSRRHRFMNCYIPRFDLAESATHYYLTGDLPGAQINDIDVTVRDEHTLVIEGKTDATTFIEDATPSSSTQPPNPNPAQIEEGEYRNGEYHKVTEKDLEGGEQGKRDEITPTQQPLPHHTRHRTSVPNPNDAPNLNPAQESHLQILLSERLTGPFHREFAFPVSGGGR